MKLNPETFWARSDLNELLKRATFSLLDYPARYAYEGAGNDCLYAYLDDVEVEILLEDGVFTVHGLDEDNEPWCMAFDQNDESDGEIL